MTTVSPARRSSARDLGRRPQAPAFEDAAFGAAGLALFVGGQAQEAVAHAGFMVGGDEGALALAAQQQVFGGQLIDRLAHRALAHLEAGGQIDFAGDEFAGLPFAAVQALDEQALDLAVQRTESGPLARWTGGAST